jgi:hypothetical protein
MQQSGLVATYPRFGGLRWEIIWTTGTAMANFANSLRAHIDVRSCSRRLHFFQSSEGGFGWLQK